MGWLDRFRRAPTALPQIPETRADAQAWPGSTIQNTLTFGGVAGIDKGASNVLVMRTPLYWTELETMYRQMGLAYRIVNAFPLAALAAGWVVDVGDQLDAARSIDASLNLRQLMTEALVDARLYGMSCLLMVTQQETPPPTGSLDLNGPLAQPMRPSERVTGLQEFGAFEMAPIQYGSDPRSPYYREPEIWQLSPMDGLGGPVMVHASRIVTFSGARMTRRIRRQWYGRDFSTLELYRDALARRDRIDGGASTVAEEMIVKAFKVAGYKSLVTGTVQQRSAAQSLWQTMTRSLGLVGAAVMDTTDELQVHNVTATGIGDIDQVSRRAISEVEGIPQVQLFGDTPSGLNTDNESGRKAWAAKVEEYETQQLAGPLRYLYARVLRVPDDQITIRFLPVEPMSERERADIELLYAQRAATLINAGAITPEEERTRLSQPEVTGRYEIDDSLTNAMLDDDTGDAVDDATDVAP